MAFAKLVKTKHSDGKKAGISVNSDTACRLYSLQKQASVSSALRLAVNPFFGGVVFGLHADRAAVCSLGWNLMGAAQIALFSMARGS